MQIQKKIEDIVFTTVNLFGQEMPVSDPIVMASAAGWYVGAVCKDPDCGGMVVPYDRYTEYCETPEQAEKLLEVC